LITNKLDELLKAELNALEIMNEQEIIKQLTDYKARFNDSEPISFSAFNKDLKINDTFLNNEDEYL
jgi:hypothetical protein